MGIFGRTLALIRAAPSIVLGSPSSGVVSSIFAPGVSNMPVNTSSALTVGAVFRAVELVSSDLAQLPWHVLRVTDGEREVLDDDPIAIVMRQPNPEMDGRTFRQVLMAHVLLRGNGYAEIERARNGSVVGLWPLNPDHVTVERVSGQIVYKVRGTGGGMAVLPQRDVFHVKGLSPDGYVGYSVIDLMRRSVSKAIASEQYGSTFFAGGGMPVGVLKTPLKVMDDTRRLIAEKWSEAYRKKVGSPQVAILDQGFEFQQLSLTPEQSQFLETQKFDVSVIARWFGVPPHKLGDMSQMTYRNIEEQERAYVISTLDPWITRWEGEADWKLSPSNDIRNRIIRNARMRADHQSRSAFYTAMWNIGVLNTNEIRRLEDLDPIGPEGDIRFRPLNMDRLGNAAEPNDIEDDGSSPVDAVMPLVVASIARVVRKVEKGVEARERFKVDAKVYADKIEQFIGGLDAEIVEVMQPCADAVAKCSGVASQPIDLWAKAWCQAMIGRAIKSEPVCANVKDAADQFVRISVGVDQ